MIEIQVFYCQIFLNSLIKLLLTLFAILPHVQIEISNNINSVFELHTWFCSVKDTDTAGASADRIARLKDED